MSDAHTEILAKGSNFIGLLKAIDTLHGAAARERVLELLPQELSTSLRLGTILVVGWYPVEWYAQLHAAIDRCLEGGPSMARQLSRTAVGADITSIHRFIIGMLSVETVFGQAHRVMGLYWKGGTIERLELARGRSRMRFTGWKGFTPLIWHDLMGGMEAVLDACGAKNGRCRTLDGGPDEGTETLEVEFRWT